MTTTLIAGRFDVLEALGESGLGAVYKVRHPERDSPCIVTVLSERLTSDSDRLAAFQAVVRDARELPHDHLVAIVDLVEDGGRHHLVEGWVEAQGLDRVLRASGALSSTDALHVARQVAAGLAQAHARGVFHGALTPASVRLAGKTPPRAVVAGLATAGLEGTSVPAYTAPEWLSGGPVDARVDIFGLGLLLFEMLEGRPLLGGRNEDAMRLLAAGKEPMLPRFSRILPSGVSALIARAIRRLPQDRQQSMEQVREEIEACLRRLGETQLTAPKVRRPVLVVDDALLEAEEEAATVEEPAAAPPVRQRARVAKPATAIPARVLTATRTRGRAGSRSMRITLAIAVVVLGLGWPLFRPRRETAAATSAPAVPPVAAMPSGSPATGARAVAPTSAVAVVARASTTAGGTGDRVARVEEARPAAVPEPAVAAVAPIVEPMQKNFAPRIVGRRPDARKPVRVTEGRPVSFGVRATDRNGDRLAYAWFVDGRQMGHGAAFHYVAPLAAMAVAHKVEVQVSDAGGAKTPRAAWTVEVLPRMTETNVRDWLGRLSSAWARQDVATLRLFRIVTGDAETEALRKYLTHYKGYRVAFANEAIRTDGQYASVAFDRRDYDGRGNLLGARRETYRLEKQPSGFVGLQAQ